MIKRNIPITGLMGHLSLYRNDRKFHADKKVFGYAHISMILIFNCLVACYFSSVLRAQDNVIRQLNHAELLSLFSGKEITGIDPSGRRWTAQFAASGTASITWEGPDGKGQDKSRWQIENNSNCLNWRALSEGKENCITVYKVNDGQYNLFNENGSLNSLVTSSVE